MSEDYEHEPGDVAVSVGRHAWERRQLCRELATGMTHRTLGRKYGVTHQAITAFAKRHAREIADIKADLDNQFSGLWIADKESRLAHYQADYEASEQHPKADHFEWVRVRTQIMHQVSEELGQLPPRAGVTIMPVLHVVEGADPEALT